MQLNIGDQVCIINDTLLYYLPKILGKQPYLVQNISSEGVEVQGSKGHAIVYFPQTSLKKVGEFNGRSNSTLSE